MKCSRCQRKNSPTTKFCGECGTPLQAANVSAPPAPSYAEVTSALADTQAQQTATSEILRIISNSSTDTRPVFDAILANALRLCGAHNGGIFTFDGQGFRMVASADVSDEFRAFMQEGVTLPGRETPLRRVGLERRVSHVVDIWTDPSFSPPEAYRREGMRTLLAVPMLKDGRLIGALAFHRRIVQPFTDQQIALLQTFADQAVIAIENVRLFNETKEALERQTATSEILRVISSSPTDVQPVFRTILGNVTRLCNSMFSVLFLSDGETLKPVAHENVSPRFAEYLSTAQARSGRHNPIAVAIAERTVVHVVDIESDSRFVPENAPAYRHEGARSILAVPMLREGNLVGMINTWRREPGGFTYSQIALLQTFADQAVIAIENVRLFKELEARNRDLTTALDRLTATAELLRVISQAQTDVQPVFETIADSAMRLLGAWGTLVFRYDGTLIHLAAARGGLPGTSKVAMDQFRPRPPTPTESGLLADLTIATRTVQHIIDIEADPSWPPAIRENARVRGWRSNLQVPMLSGDEVLGTIGVSRAEPGGFSPAEIALLQTFADQAVIALKNARLLEELQTRTAQLSRSVDELTALGEVGQAISSTLDLQTVLSTIVARATQLSGTDAGVIYEYDDQREVFLPRATAHLEAEIVETMLSTPVRKGEGATGQLAEVQEPIQLPDILDAPAESRVRGALVRAGYRALLAVPLVREDHLLGGLTVIRKTTGEFAPEVIELLQTFATQSALAIQNARLFLEIEDKSRQLEAASRHKSEFLANMSHELRTPMNAILGFSEVLAEGMFGEINDKQAEYLRDILESGRHLLSLINDILDLSKIEAGRMELEPTDFDLPVAIDNTLALVRERAGRRGITLGREIDERVGMIRADERKVKQVVLNLLSNAIKFTPEGGRIDVRGAVNEGLVEVSVTDTGVGIAPEDQETVFEEFRQVGTADKKVEGTGLGLALSRKFVELHGGRIWVKSHVGRGSTFTFTLPVR